LLVSKIEIDRDQITTAQRAAEILDTPTDPTVSAGDLLLRLFNSIAPTVSETSNTGPTITTERACGAQIHCEANYTRKEYVAEVMKAMMRLEALDVLTRPKIYEESEGRHPHESDDAPAAYELLRRTIGLTMGVWNDTPDLVGWPSGVAGVQKCTLTGDNVGLANLLEAYADLAEAVLTSVMGRVHYMLGLPFTCDAMRFTSHNVTGLSVAKGFFFAPRTAIPFLFDVLRIPWGSANNGCTEALIVRNAATNRATIEKMRDGGHVYSLCEVLDMIRTPDEVVRDPAMFISDQLPMETNQKWIYNYDHGGEIEQIGASLFDSGGVLNAPELAINPATDPDAMDVSEPAGIDATETFGSASSPPKSAALILQAVTREPVRTGGDINVEVDPSIQNVTAPCAAEWGRKEMMDQIIAKATVLAKDLEELRRTSLRGLDQVPLPAPGSIVDGWVNPSPTECNNLWRKWSVSVATEYFDINDPASVPHINNDAIMACNMLAAAQEQRAPLTGWDMCPEQINWLCNNPTCQLSPNTIMKVRHLDIYTVSDSTRSMHPAGSQKTKCRNIALELEEHNKHCRVTVKPGGAQTDLLKAIIEAGDAVKKNGGSPLAVTMLHVTWDLNEVFDGAGNVILGDYDANLQMGLKLLLGGMALGEAAKQYFPRSVIVAGGCSTNWKARKELDFFASCARLGIMRTGHIVRAGERHYEKLSDRKARDEWHFEKKEPWDMGSAANSFAKGIARDCLFAQKVQSGATTNKMSA
jgi:hypothetical protein